MNILGNEIIGELVAKDYRTASVFKKYNIDFCCQGNRSIDDACLSDNINTQSVINELEQLKEAKTGQAIDYQSWPVDLLADYIEKKHHRYVEDRTQEILPYLDKICRVHGGRHPELMEIQKQFKEAAGELAAHMKKEELILFPYIRKMVKSQKANIPMDKSHFGKVENPIHMMMDEHSTEGERFRKIQSLSNTYTPPKDACNTYQVTLALLQEFEEDLHLHIHLENNILFLKVLELEKEIS